MLVSYIPTVGMCWNDFTHRLLVKYMMLPNPNVAQFYPNGCCFDYLLISIPGRLVGDEQRTLWQLNSSYPGAIPGEFYPKGRWFVPVPWRPGTNCSAILHLRGPLHLCAGPRRGVHSRGAGDAGLAVTPKGLREKGTCPVPKGISGAHSSWNHGNTTFWWK